MKLFDRIIIYGLLLSLGILILSSPGYQAQQDRQRRLDILESQVDYLQWLVLINSYSVGNLQLVKNAKTMETIKAYLTAVDSTAEYKGEIND